MNIKLKKKIFTLTLASGISALAVTGCKSNQHEIPSSNYAYFIYRNEDGMEVFKVRNNFKDFKQSIELVSYPDSMSNGKVNDRNEKEFSTKSSQKQTTLKLSSVQLIPVEKAINKDTFYYSDLTYFDRNSEEAQQYLEKNYHYPEVFHSEMLEKDFPCSLFERENVLTEEVTYNLGYQIKEEDRPSVIYDIPSGLVVYFSTEEKVTVTPLELENGITIKEAKEKVASYQTEPKKVYSK